jgi:hypothetical protein
VLLQKIVRGKEVPPGHACVRTPLLPLPRSARGGSPGCSQPAPGGTQSKQWWHEGAEGKVSCSRLLVEQNAPGLQQSFHKGRAVHAAGNLVCNYRMFSYLCSVPEGKQDGQLPAANWAERSLILSGTTALPPACAVSSCCWWPRPAPCRRCSWLAPEAGASQTASEPFSHDG